MNRQIKSKKVFLVGEEHEDNIGYEGVTEQLNNIVGHIEDLVEVNHLVKQSEATNVYLVAQQDTNSEQKV